MRIILADKATNYLRKGIREAGELVRVTYGPTGGTVVLGKRGKVITTADGSTALRSLKNRMGTGFDLSLATAIGVEDKWGDGTSTTAILSQAIVEAGLATHGHGLDAALEVEREWPQSRESLCAMSVMPNEENLWSVGMRASKGDEEIVEALVKAVSEVGVYGTVVLERGFGLGIETQITDGMRINEKWASCHFASDGEDTSLEGPLVAVCRGHLLKFEDIAPILEEASQWPGRPIAVFAEGVRGVALDTMIQNHTKKVLNLLAIEYRGNPKGVRDWLDDIASVTNATIYDRSFMGSYQSEWLGSARKISVSHKGTVITPYRTPEVSERIEKRISILSQLAEGTDHDFDRDQYNRRAAEMDGGLCIVKIGGITDLEAIERRSRTEDTLHALNAALTTGVVPGAGVALTQCGSGAILSKALAVPRKILKDAEDPGWDPLGVVLGCSEAAVSLALQVLRTGAVLTSGS